MKTAEAHNAPQTGSYKFTPKVKRAKAIWTKAFPTQAKALRPENTAAGGVKARSQSESVRMAVYLPIAALFKHANPWCQCCVAIRGVNFNDARLTTQIHHRRGRAGLLLYDTRYFLACCQTCHNWIGENIEESRKLGLICDKGDWNKES